MGFDNSPIGVFDSGMGGLTVWRELRRELPRESLVYFGDGANCPYGEKSGDDVLRFIVAGIEKLLERDVKMIVIACNTATMAGIKYLREHYDIPFVGMEPAVKPAVGSTESGVVGVLATKASLGSDWFRRLKEQYDDKARIIIAEGEGFVRLVEADAENTPEALEAVRQIIKPMVDAGADRIVLGCTHYPFLRERMREVIGERQVEIIDPAPAIVRRVKWLLDEYGINASTDNVPHYDFVTAGSEEYLGKLEKKAFR